MVDLQRDPLVDRSRTDPMAADHGAFSMPWDAPLAPPFPIRFRNVSVLTVCYRTDPEAIDRLLPAPVERTSPVVLINIAHMPDTDAMGAINEMVGARVGHGRDAVEGGYSPYLFLDSDAGLAHGREVHGQPKKMASVRLEACGDLLIGTVERNGIELITVTLPYKLRAASRDDMRAHFDFTENINFKAVSHIDGRPAIRQLTARRLADLDMRECWGGPCTVELRPNAQAPVWRLSVIEPLDGYFWTGGFTLTGGRIIHDYLEGH